MTAHLLKKKTFQPFSNIFIDNNNYLFNQIVFYFIQFYFLQTVIVIK